MKVWCRHEVVEDGERGLNPFVFTELLVKSLLPIRGYRIACPYKRNVYLATLPVALVRATPIAADVVATSPIHACIVESDRAPA